MRLSAEILSAVEATASSASMDPALLCAVVDVEGGSVDALLFEKHRFTANLRALGVADKIPLAKSQGLAVDKWLGHAEYADEATHAERVDMLKRACEIHEEAAYRSASYGLFQCMGENFAACGYASAKAMHEDFATGLDAQLRAFMRFAGSNGALAALKSKNWSKFARIWNGAGYKTNSYDARLAAAYARYEAQLRGVAKLSLITPPPADTLSIGDKGPRVEALQKALSTTGYIVNVDGDFGPATRRAVAAAQVDFGTPGNGIADAAFIAKLETSAPLSKGAREVADADTLRERGSRTIDAADKIRSLANTGAISSAAAGVASVSGAFDKATDVVSFAGDKFERAQSTVSTSSSLYDFFSTHPGVIAAVVAVVACAVVWAVCGNVIEARLSDHKSGKTV